MIRHLVMAALFVSTIACAQSSRNRIERGRDRQELGQDKRQLKDDRRDAARTLGMLGDYDAAAAANDVPRLGALDVAFNEQLNQELAESSRDAAKERLSKARLLELQAQLAAFAGRFDPPTISRKRALYGEVLGLAFNELKRDKRELREDRRETREDRRE